MQQSKGCPESYFNNDYNQEDDHFAQINHWLLYLDAVLIGPELFSVRRTKTVADGLLSLFDSLLEAVSVPRKLLPLSLTRCPESKGPSLHLVNLHNGREFHLER